MRNNIPQIHSTRYRKREVIVKQLYEYNFANYQSSHWNNEVTELADIKEGNYLRYFNDGGQKETSKYQTVNINVGNEFYVLASFKVDETRGRFNDDLGMGVYLKIGNEYFFFGQNAKGSKVINFRKEFNFFQRPTNNSWYFTDGALISRGYQNRWYWQGLKFESNGTISRLLYDSVNHKLVPDINNVVILKNDSSWLGVQGSNITEIGFFAQLIGFNFNTYISKIAVNPV